MNYQETIQQPEYDFLRTNPALGENIILLTLGGSHAYGTNIKGSDLDVRGITAQPVTSLLTNSGFEQVEDRATDTVIYGFNKIITLLSNCNPNTIEMLGCKPEHYLVLTDVGQYLIDHADMFLSRKAIHAFGGYATQQLRRLENKANLSVGQAQQEKHILDTINNASVFFKDKYAAYPEDAMRLYLDASDNPDYEKEIFMDVHLTHYPLRDYKAMWSDMHSIVKDYSKIGRRNEHALMHGKITKHMMHLIRLFCMCLDILEKKQIITYRAEEHDLLMDIRNGKYIDANDQPTDEFYEMVDAYEKRFQYAKENTDLPDNPNYKEIQEFQYQVNLETIRSA